MPLRSRQSTSGSPPANDVGKPAAESTLRWMIGVLSAAESTLWRVLWVIVVLMIADLAIAVLLPH